MLDLTRFPENPAVIAIAAALCFLIGSFPTGYLIGKWFKGIDIRDHGSGNPGAANVFRTVGKSAGGLTLLIDALKGFLPVQTVLWAFPGHLLIASGIGMAAIAGHNWSVFLSFKGGKGVATSTGVFLALVPLPTLIAVIVFVIGLLSTGHVSVGSMAGAVALSLSTWVLTASPFLTSLTVICALMVLFQHRKNISRIFRKEELKISVGGKDGT